MECKLGLDIEYLKEYNYSIIEKWWRSLGCWDRCQVCGVPYADEDTAEYLEFTDNWWSEKTDNEKVELYNEFFSEC